MVGQELTIDQSRAWRKKDLTHGSVGKPQVDALFKTGNLWPLEHPPPTCSWVIFDFILKLGIQEHETVSLVAYVFSLTVLRTHRLDEELLLSFAEDQKASQTAIFHL